MPKNWQANNQIVFQPKQKVESNVRLLRLNILHIAPLQFPLQASFLQNMVLHSHQHLSECRFYSQLGESEYFDKQL